MSDAVLGAVQRGRDAAPRRVRAGKVDHNGTGNTARDRVGIRDRNVGTAALDRPNRLRRTEGFERR